MTVPTSGAHRVPAGAGGGRGWWPSVVAIGGGHRWPGSARGEVLSYTPAVATGSQCITELGPGSLGAPGSTGTGTGMGTGTPPPPLPGLTLQRPPPGTPSPGWGCWTQAPSRCPRCHHGGFWVTEGWCGATGCPPWPGLGVALSPGTGWQRGDGGRVPAGAVALHRQSCHHPRQRWRPALCQGEGHEG